MPYFPRRSDDARPPTQSTARKREKTRSLLLVVWLVVVASLLVVGVSWQIIGTLTRLSLELAIFLVWLPGLFVGAMYLDARYS